MQEFLTPIAIRPIITLPSTAAFCVAATTAGYCILAPTNENNKSRLGASRKKLQIFRHCHPTATYHFLLTPDNQIVLHSTGDSAECHKISHLHPV
jgi:hypothetical protein